MHIGQQWSMRLFGHLPFTMLWTSITLRFIKGSLNHPGNFLPVNPQPGNLLVTMSLVPQCTYSTALQDQPGSLHKWRSWAWQGIYLGHSNMHASNVTLVYNPDTKHATPQFHVSLDDSFTSIVPLIRSKMTRWQRLFYRNLPGYILITIQRNTIKTQGG